MKGLQQGCTNSKQRFNLFGLGLCVPFITSRVDQSDTNHTDLPYSD